MTGANPRFITLEGGEGVGKSTLAAGLQSRFEKAGATVVRTREPGGSRGADEIRALIVSGSGDRWNTLTETLLLTAARADHLERTIRPALDRGDWVICDRFIDSTYAYQVVARGLARATFDTLNIALDAPAPALTIVLDLDVDAGLARTRSRPGDEARFEAMGRSFHERVRAAFLEIATREPTRCAVIDAAQPADVVLQRACDLVRDRLGIIV